MPEQISKYPDVTLEVLKGAGARCGPGVEKKILTQCPDERFCALPTGEICVFGLEQIPQMTQITTRELASVVCAPVKPEARGAADGLDTSAWIAVGMALAVGLGAGRLWGKR